MELKILNISDSSEVMCVKDGDVKWFNLDHYYEYLRLVSFLQTIHEIKTHEDVEVLKKKLAKKDFSAFVTYIPELQDYERQYEEMNVIESFERSLKKDLLKISKNFKEFKNSYTPNDAIFCIIKNPIALKSLKISQEILGNLLLIEKPSVFNNFSKNV